MQTASIALALINVVSASQGLFGGSITAGVFDHSSTAQSNQQQAGTQAGYGAAAHGTHAGYAGAAHGAHAGYGGYQQYPHPQQHYGAYPGYGYAAPGYGYAAPGYGQQYYGQQYAHPHAQTYAHAYAQPYAQTAYAQPHVQPIVETKAEPVVDPVVVHEPVSDYPNYGNDKYEVDQELYENTYASCSLKTLTGAIAGKIQFFQQPHYAVKVKADISGLNASTQYDIKITEQGDITGQCGNMGSDYESLFESYNIYDDWGRVLRNHSHGDGMINTLTSDASGNVTAFTQDDLLQNLAGEKSLLGRGIQLSVKDDDVVLACCAIGIDVEPVTLGPGQHYDD